MKKLSLVLIFMAGLFFAGNAQFDKGENALDLGIGPSPMSGGTGLGVMLNFEHGSIDIPDVGVIGFGGVLGYRHYSYINNGYRYGHSFIIPALRGSFHFQFFDSGNFDLYAGAALGLWIYSNSYQNNNVKNSNVDFFSDFFIGTRYWFSNSFGLFAELGYGISIFKGGVSFKF